ncbi:MAG: cyclic-phosphate processing receiver domain-containing protein [Pyrinomonadaceae bacterium]
MSIVKAILIKFGLANLEASRAPISVFLLDDDERRHRWFRKRFAGDHLDIAKDVEEARRLLQLGNFDAIFLDHDLLPHHYESNSHDDFDRTGYAIAQFLSDNPEIQPAATLIVHTRNGDAGLKMVELLRKADRQVEYVAFPMLDLKIKHYWNK